MTTTAAVAFQVRAARPGDEQDAGWELVTNPPGVQSYGDDDFVDPGVSGRAYVNGHLVVGLQKLEVDDFVRLCTAGGMLAFRYAGRGGLPAEPGAGRPCAFTGFPIHGLAMRCAACGRVVSQAAAAQIGECACGQPLGVAQQPVAPPEELL